MINKHVKNKLKTAGYFIKRLRDSKFETIRIFNDYGDHDPRKWTVLVDPKNTSVYITCYENKNQNNEVMFTFDDGRQLFHLGYSLKTHSIEVVIQKLIDKGVQQRKD